MVEKFFLEDLGRASFDDFYYLFFAFYFYLVFFAGMPAMSNIILFYFPVFLV